MLIDVFWSPENVFIVAKFRRKMWKFELWQLLVDKSYPIYFLESSTPKSDSRYNSELWL